MASTGNPAPRVGRRRLSALVAVTFVFGGGVSLVVDLARGADCEAASITASVVADTWLDEDSPSATKGSDSVLDVDAGSLNVDTGEIKGRSRALLRFALPAGVPMGCVVESARLRVFSAEESVGTRVEALQLASAWSESTVSWSTQPATIGTASTIWSREAYMQWNVTAQVQAMLGGVNHGFLLRDAAEGTEAGGGGHGFYGREKGESPAHIIIQFAPPAPEEDPGPPRPPSPATVSCGQELTQSTLVTNDLSNCLGDGLVIGAPRIIVDLGGHTIDGIGLGSGIRNDGYASVTVRNGTVQEFDYGVQLFPETTLNVVELLTLRANQVAAVELFDVAGSEVRGNTLDQNGGGILLVSGTRDIVVANNTVTANGGAGLLVRDATANRLEHNSVVGGGDLGISLERASGNTLLGNISSDNSDGGIEIRAGSHDNHVEGNTVLRSGDHGILVSESDRTVLVGNTAHEMSDSGITLDAANDGVVRGNDVRFNTGGLQLDGSSRNVLEANDASDTSGIGIELGGGSLENVLSANTVAANGAQGIYVADDATDGLGAPVPGLGNVLIGNMATANLSDGIVVAKGGHTLTANVANANRGWGINAALVGTIDGGSNVAVGNQKPEQCVGVECREEWVAPETTISVKPPDATRSTSATFGFTGADDTSPVASLRFACSLDGAAFTTCVSPRLLTGLAHGPHTFAVRATDRAGNTDPSPATHTWVIDSVPPETTLGDRPPDLSNAAAATFTFAGSDEGGGGSSVTFECRLDAGGEWGACSSPSDYSDLADGAHTFAVRATDAAGNTDASPAAYAWTIDTTPPQTAIESGPADPTNGTSATFDHSANEPATFACALDEAEPAPCGASVSFADLAEGTHTFTVVATDAAGNMDLSAATRTWTIDTTPPETTIDAAPADPTNSTTATFEHSANEPATFSCALNGADPAPCGASVSYAGLAEGTHTFTVAATDRAGNADASRATHTWTVDTTPPETTIDAGPADPTSATNAGFQFSASEAASFTCALDGAETVACNASVTYSGLGEGPHSFAVAATDAAGNFDTSPATFSWTIDTTPPETTIDDGPADPTKATTATFEFSASEAASFACALDGAEPAACGATATYDDLAEGTHTFTVVATDAAGNTDDSPATHAWTIDTTPPETTIDAAPADPTNATSATFSLSASEAATFSCTLDGAAPVPCNASVTYAGLAEGTHSFTVVATDAAGNTDASSATHAWRVDTTPPETTIESAPESPTNSASATFEHSANEPATFACALDGAEPAPCGASVTHLDLGEGTHTFAVVATDAAGNADASPPTHTWTVDTTPPETTIDAAPADPTNATSATFSLSASEAATFACALDGVASVPCGALARYDGLSEGRHDFVVAATDAAGNTDASPATHSWTVDTTPPETSIESGPAHPTNATSATFAISASEQGSTLTCSLDAAQPAVCATLVIYSALVDGRHTFTVFAIDAAGNADGSPATHAWTIDTTPPETTIDSAPTNPTNSTSATFEHSANEPATFACALDGAEPAPCGASVTYLDLGEGTHSFAVVGTDAAGNADASPATHIWTIETEAPPPSDSTPPETTLGGSPADPTNEPSARFTFGGSDDTSEPNALQFECRLDSSDPGDFATCSSPADYSGLAAGPHTFEVRAVDAAGNADPESARFAWTIDTDPPETSITGGPTGSTRSTSAAVSFAGSDNLTPASELALACALDDGDFVACTSPVSLTGLAGGSHTFRVVATDQAGNADPEAAERSWTVDLTAPETRLTGQPENPSNQTSATFTFDGSDDIDDPSALRFECRLDAAAFAGCTSPRTYTGLSAGSHTFEARAIDAVGNVDPSPALHAWAIDTTPPNTTITGGPAANSTTTSTSASFTFTASETGSAFQCSLDSTSAYAACSSPSTYTGLSVGTHTFRVRSIDAAGNVDATPAIRTWTIQGDTTPPNTTIIGGPAANSTTTSTSASFTFTASETGSTFQCSLDSTFAYTACSSPQTYTGLTAGSHTFRVRAIDAAGNVDATPASRSWTVESTSGCGQVTLVATADAWIEQNSSSSNKGSDSILKVKSQGPTDNFRALVTFALPSVPADCTFGSATLRMFAASATSGRTIETFRLNGPWTENGVTWNIQPPTTGGAATTASGAGYREWNVTTHVQAMYDGTNHGFLLRDATESGSGFEQQFHSREKGEQPPQLVLAFTVAGAGGAFGGPVTGAGDYPGGHPGDVASLAPARLGVSLTMIQSYTLIALVLAIVVLIPQLARRRSDPPLTA